MPRYHSLQDALLQDASTALSATAGTAYSSSFDLMNSAKGSFTAPCELKLVAPAMTASFAAEKTVTYALYDSADDSSFTIKNGYEAICQQVFAAGVAGVATETVHIALPADIRRYIKVGVTTPAGSGDLSTGTFAVYVNC